MVGKEKRGKEWGDDEGGRRGEELYIGNWEEGIYIGDGDKSIYSDVNVFSNSCEWKTLARGALCNISKS